MLLLKEIRKAAGKTQQDVADGLKLARGSYTNIENGKRDPDTQTLLAIADYFNVPLDALFGRDFKSTADADASEFAETEDEKRLLRAYRSLSEQGQEYIRQQFFMALAIYKRQSGIADMESERVG